MLLLSALPWLSRVFCRIRCTDMDFSRSDGAAEVEAEVAAEAEAELRPAHLPPASPLAHVFVEPVLRCCARKW